jgi:hypothetical protein
MERMCAADDSPEEVSIFSFPDSIGEDLLLWDHEDETDPDRTLTTLTLQTDTPTSSGARKGHSDHHHILYEDTRNGNGNRSFYPNGSGHNNSNDQGPTHHHHHSVSNNSRPHIGYVNGTLSNSFHGYFRTTAV